MSPEYVSRSELHPAAFLEEKVLHEAIYDRSLKHTLTGKPLQTWNSPIREGFMQQGGLELQLGV